MFFFCFKYLWILNLVSFRPAYQQVTKKNAFYNFWFTTFKPFHFFNLLLFSDNQSKKIVGQILSLLIKGFQNMYSFFVLSRLSQNWFTKKGDLNSLPLVLWKFCWSSHSLIVDFSTCNSKNLSNFKKKISQFIDLPHNRTYNRLNNEVIKHITRLRRVLSYPRDQKFKPIFFDSLNPNCSYRVDIETLFIPFPQFYKSKINPPEHFFKNKQRYFNFLWRCCSQTSCQFWQIIRLSH